MFEPASTYRMAIGSLEVPEPLRNAVDELRAQNIPAAKLSIAATADTIEGLRAQRWPEADSYLAPLLQVIPLPIIETFPIYATSRSWLTELKSRDRSTATGGSTHRRCWLTPSLRQGLLDCMLNGEVMLLAGPLTASELTASTRVLLRHSNRSVQSHTFAPPGAE